MYRNLLSIRRKTHDQKNLSAVEMGAIQLDFVEYLRKKKRDFEVPDRMIVNMDETGLYFDMQPKTTIASKGIILLMLGSKHINIKTTGNSNHCTVFLAVALDGSKLKPLVVFKGQPGGSVTREFSEYDTRNAYICQSKAYCDSDVMTYWTQMCLAPYYCNMEPAILMLDNFSPHCVRPVKIGIAKLGCLQVNLPPNMTSKVQILDVGINKPFKDRMNRHYMEFMIDNSSRAPKITRKIMASWVADSWAGIASSTITNTARNIGFIRE